MVCLDTAGHMTCATSTSGLFMKHPGRLGDSCVCGSGFYVKAKPIAPAASCAADYLAN